MTDAARRYLDLLKRCLTREIFIDQEFQDVRGWPAGGPLGDPEEIWSVLRQNNMRIVKPLVSAEGRHDGRDWPMHAETMAGMRRLDNVQELVERALDAGTPGDLVETGVWRGGVTILMAALLDVHGQTERKVWVCDSFEGLPQPNPERYPADADHPQDARLLDQVAVSLEEVKRNFARYGLLDGRVEFLKGWFGETLPTAPISRIAVLRLDGDLYESTIDALSSLEPRVAPGGYIIIDDYNSWEPCRAAVDDYRRDHGIVADIHEIDWTGVWWQKAP